MYAFEKTSRVSFQEPATSADAPGPVRPSILKKSPARHAPYTVVRGEEEKRADDELKNIMGIKKVKYKNRKNVDNEVYVKYLDPKRALRAQMFSNCFNFFFAPSNSGKTFFMIYLLYEYLVEMLEHRKKNVFLVFFGNTPSAFNFINRLQKRGLLQKTDPILDSVNGGGGGSSSGGKAAASTPKFHISCTRELKDLSDQYEYHTNVNTSKANGIKFTPQKGRVDPTEYEWVYFMDDVTKALFEKDGKRFFTDFFSMFRHLNITVILNTQNIKNIPPAIRDQVSSVGSLYLLDTVSPSNSKALFTHFGLVSDRFDTHEDMHLFYKKWVKNEMPPFTVTIYNNLKRKLQDREEHENDCIYLQRIPEKFANLLKKIDLELEQKK